MTSSLKNAPISTRHVRQLLTLDFTTTAGGIADLNKNPGVGSIGSLGSCLMPRNSITFCHKNLKKHINTAMSARILGLAQGFSFHTASKFCQTWFFQWPPGISCLPGARNHASSKHGLSQTPGKASTRHAEFRWFLGKLPAAPVKK